MNSTYSMDHEEHPQTFESWLGTIVHENQNLKLLARQLEGFEEKQFQSWIEDGLAKVVLKGDHPLGAFQPGQLIVGALSRRSWREEILAAVALTSEATKNRAARGFVNAFQGIAPAVHANDVSANDGRNNECLVIDMLKIVRELRAPLYSREATPLDALRHLLTMQYPNSLAVFNECLVTWRAFAHQVRLPEVAEWANTFERHRNFSDEYALFIAYGLATADPANARSYLFEWAPVRRYRRSLANEGSSSEESRVKLKRLTETTCAMLASSKRNRQLSMDDFRHIQQSDATTVLVWQISADDYRPQIYAAENHGRSANLTLSNFCSRRLEQSMPLQMQASSHELGATI